MCVYIYIYILYIYIYIYIYIILDIGNVYFYMMFLDSNMPKSVRHISDIHNNSLIRLDQIRMT